MDFIRKAFTSFDVGVMLAWATAALFAALTEQVITWDVLIIWILVYCLIHLCVALFPIPKQP